jgi:hypothetical protein
MDRLIPAASSEAATFWLYHPRNHLKIKWIISFFRPCRRTTESLI